MKDKVYQSQDLYSKQYKQKWLHEEKEIQASYLFQRVKGLKIRKKAKVLDIGCGIGTFGSFFKKQLLGEAYGLELNDEAIAQAKKNQLLVKKGDIEKKWPFQDKMFDTVLSVQLIEHLVDPDFSLEESRRVLKKKGLIIITTPNLAAWFNRGLLLFGYQPFFLEVSTVDKTLGLDFTRKLSSNRIPLGHVRGFTLKALHDILTLHKFRIVHSYGGEVTYLPKILKPLDKFFSNFPGLATDLIVVAEKI